MMKFKNVFISKTIFTLSRFCRSSGSNSRIVLELESIKNKLNHLLTSIQLLDSGSGFNEVIAFDRLIKTEWQKQNSIKLTKLIE
jgi:hypothetical protein